MGTAGNGRYQPFYFNQPLAAAGVEIADDMFVITAERAEAYLRAQAPAEPAPPAHEIALPAPTLGVKDGPAGYYVAGGDVPAQKWVNFYMKVLTKLAATHALQLSLHVHASGASGISPQKAEEVSSALRELGLDDRVELE